MWCYEVWLCPPVSWKALLLTLFPTPWPQGIYLWPLLTSQKFFMLNTLTQITTEMHSNKKPNEQSHNMLKSKHIHVQRTIYLKFSSLLLLQWTISGTICWVNCYIIRIRLSEYDPKQLPMLIKRYLNEIFWGAVYFNKNLHPITESKRKTLKGSLRNHL